MKRASEEGLHSLGRRISPSSRRKSNDPETEPKRAAIFRPQNSGHFLVTYSIRFGGPSFGPVFQSSPVQHQTLRVHVVSPFPHSGRLGGTSFGSSLVSVFDPPPEKKGGRFLVPGRPPEVYCVL